MLRNCSLAVSNAKGSAVKWLKKLFIKTSKQSICLGNILRTALRAMHRTVIFTSLSHFTLFESYTIHWKKHSLFTEMTVPHIQKYFLYHSDFSAACVETWYALCFMLERNHGNFIHLHLLLTQRRSVIHTCSLMDHRPPNHQYSFK